ncbi:hypothetical protein SAMN02745163_03691 [Clostridium cavendishii DSM 21758]|uniref:Uncharacterized protein n=1 Tax=Clostridium cavendishii DSM 21758 TaxID=1121302 RepID=A0A1M6RWP2_9CLOT|nr:hypothetical protein [Clostridium cavendishii]SHK36906.1 hypothetical protein SAMN02745163_03691 [Clostridium cavendishii DSM 21758]
MGIEYQLVNKTKKEIITYIHIPASKKRELAGNTISASITTWYLLNNSGDEIKFVSDEEYFKENDKFKNYKDVTEEVIIDLIKNNIIRDEGIEYMDEDENSCYIRKLINIWCE